ncbi:MAG TPA: metalloregulator ArsR/SmtB family transcription factor [Burkholderiales bacterium]
MVKYEDPVLDRVFSALADPTRRGVLDSLAGGSCAVSELAAPSGMSLPGFMKHLRVLEEAGLIEREKEGRVVSCELAAAPMKAASAWMSRYEKFWSDKLDSLARYLYQQEELQTWNKPAFKPTSPSTSPRSSSSGNFPSRRRKSGGRGPIRRR